MKLIVCDVEGTIFKAKFKIEGAEYASTMWQPIAHMLGEEATKEEMETHRKWKNDEYSGYCDWMRDTIKIHIKYGLKQEGFEELIQNAEYCNGVEQFFRELDRTKYLPILVSGGFQNLSKRAQIELKIEHSFTACEYYFNNTGFLSGFNLLPSDFEGKLQFVNIILKDYKISDNDWIFIGDGDNDAHIAENSPLSIGFCPQKKLKAVTKHNVDNFMDILKLI